MEKPKTVFVTAKTGSEIRTFFVGDFWRLARSRPDLKLVVFAPKEKFESYAKMFSHERCIFEPLPGGLDSAAKSLFRTACLASIPTRTIRFRIWMNYLNGGGVAGFLGRCFMWLLGHMSFWRPFMRFIEYRLFYDDRVWRDYFEKYKPDAVFATSLLNEEDITLVKHARRRGVPSAAKIAGWDNLSSKDPVRAVADVILVQNKKMVKEAESLCGVSAGKIKVIGAPQWDHYLDPSWRMPKEWVAEKIGADPKKRWITYFSGGLTASVMVFSKFRDHIEMLRRAIQNGVLNDAQVILKIHPIETYSAPPEWKDRVVVTNFGAGMNFFEDDMKLMANLLRYSDVTVNSGSTMSLEAAIFDKPVVLVGFEGYGDEGAVPWHRRLSAALDNTNHYLDVQKTGGVWRVSNEKEFIEAVRLYLESPELHHEGRERMVREITGPADGKAGIRVLEAIVSLVGVKTKRP